MIRPHRLLLYVALAGTALSACGTSVPATAPELDRPATASIPLETPTNTVAPSPTRQATLDVATPAATSRGPDLQASDPAAARLDSGSLQLVEFFRFT